MSADIVPDSSLQSLDAELKRVLAGEGGLSILDTVDEQTGNALRRHMLFAHLPYLLAKLGIQIGAAGRFYNAYYWLFMFSKCYGSRYGYDPGIEQQVYKFLEAAVQPIDWEEIAWIEERVNGELSQS